MRHGAAIWGALLLALGAACSEGGQPEPEAAPEMTTAEPEITPDEARATAEEAYVFAYPMLEHYRTFLGMLRAQDSPFYLGAFNVFDHDTELLGPEVTEIVRPNNDTLYSKAVLDLRAEPIVLSVPAVPDRYYSFQLIDLYTHNIGYVGTRATGTEAGSYLIAGPSWPPEPPPGIDGVIRSEGPILVALGRTAVRDAADVANVEEIQAGYTLQPLSAFLGEPPPAPQPDYAFPPIGREQTRSPAFLEVFAFLMGQLEVDPSEEEMIGRFLALRDALGEPGIYGAVQEGMEAARQRIRSAAPDLGKQRDGWFLLTGLFGNREGMQGKYLTRAAAAMLGLWGNDEEEAYYPSTGADGQGVPLDGSQHRYELRFAREELPDVEAFWSITMYGLPGQHMVANPIDRYSIGDRTEGVVYEEDGSLAILVQAESPGPEQEANWLPAPAGPFSLTLRMYLPAPEALDGPYAPPPLRRVE